MCCVGANFAESPAWTRHTVGPLGQETRGLHGLAVGPEHAAAPGMKPLLCQRDPCGDLPLLHADVPSPAGAVEQHQWGLC